MSKLAVIGLVVAAVVSFSASNAMAYRYFGGSYTYLAPHCDTSWPWTGNTDIGPGPHPYDGTSAMSDGDATLNPTHQTYDANPSQVSFTDPGDSTGPGTSAVWWGTAGSEPFPTILLDPRPGGGDRRHCSRRQLAIQPCYDSPLVQGEGQPRRRKLGYPPVRRSQPSR